MNRYILVLLTACVMSFTGMAQQVTRVQLRNGETCNDVLRNVYAKFDRVNIPYNTLYNRVIGWSSLLDWQQGDTTSPEHIGQAWFDLEQSQNRPGNSFQQLRELRTRGNAENNILMLGIAYGFSFISKNALSEKPIKLNWRNRLQVDAKRIPFEKKEVFLAALDRKEFEQLSEYRLSSSLSNVLINSDISVSGYTLENTTYSGEPRLVVPVDGDVVLRFANAGEQTLRITMHTNRGDFDCYQTVSVRSLCSDRADIPRQDGGDISSAIPFKGYDEGTARTSEGNYEIRFHYDVNSSVNTLRKPIIIVDGFDPEDKRSANELYNKNLSFGGENLGEILRTMGYDIVVLNFPNGGDYIERNAFILVALIQKLNQQLKQAGSTEKLVIVGPSMGGQISRYALAYMEKHGLDHNTRLWVSFDSPHLGANIPIAVQEDLIFLGNTAGVQDAKDKYGTMLQCPAAKQMLIHQCPTASGFGGKHSFHKRYYSDLKNNGLPGSDGFPQNLRKIALINGNGGGRQCHGAAAEFLKIDAKYKILGINFNVFHLYNRFLPNYGQTVQYFEGRYTDKYFLGIDVITSKMPITNSDSRGCLDIVPGGLFDSQLEIRNSVVPALKKQKLNVPTPVLLRNHSFIPTVSALAFKNPNFDWSQRVDDRNLVQTGEIPFDDYFIPAENQEHVQLTVESARWLINQIEKDVNYNQINVYLSGPNKVCSTSTFSLSNVPSGASIQWTYSSNLVYVSGQGTSKLVVKNSSSFTNEDGWVRATITVGGIQHVLPTKSVYVGIGVAPSIMGPYDGDWVAMEICPCKPSYFMVVDKAQGVSQYEWTLTGDGLPTMYDGERADFFVSREGRYTISCRQYHEGCGWSEPTEQSFYASSMAGNCPSCNGHIISPNPGSGIIRIAVAEPILQEAVRGSAQAQPIRSVRMFSQQGALVLERSFGSGLPEVHIDLSQLRPGTYHLLINGTEHHVVVRE